MTTSLARRALSWFGFVPGRVLQLEEVRVSAREALRSGALEGLSTRYVPSRVDVAVSPEDWKFLGPFRSELLAMLRSDATSLSHEKGWAASATDLDLRIDTDASLRRGDPARISTTFGDGAVCAIWGGNAAQPARKALDILEIVVTAQSDEGTALQERILLAFPDTISPGTSSMPTPSGVVSCPGGKAVVGREPGEAQVVPRVPVPLMSRAHVELAPALDGSVSVRDLGSSNGTWLDGARLGAEPVRAPLPFSLSIGVGGRASIDVRRAVLPEEPAA